MKKPRPLWTLLFLAYLAALLRPFLPFSSEKIAGWLGTGLDWREQEPEAERILPEISVLFRRIGSCPDIG